MWLTPLIAIWLLGIAPMSPAASLTGTWVLDRVKSDFGGAEAPQVLIVQLSQVANGLDITTLIADASGQRVRYRQGLVPDQITGKVSWTTSGDPGEEWKITAAGELTIRRTLDARSRIIRQYLVLVRSDVVE